MLYSRPLIFRIVQAFVYAFRMWVSAVAVQSLMKPVSVLRVVNKKRAVSHEACESFNVIVLSGEADVTCHEVL